MGTEVEAKMQLADVASLEAELVAHNAQPGPAFREINTFFDTVQGSLKSTDQGLRLRVEQLDNSTQERVIITHKGPRADGMVKIRSETELVVEDARKAADLLNSLGFVRVLSFEKHRHRWFLHGCNVELDRLPYLGDFVEIEGNSESTVLAVREKLGLQAKPLIRTSYIGLLRTYMAEHQITADHITFGEDTSAS